MIRADLSPIEGSSYALAQMGGAALAGGLAFFVKGSTAALPDPWSSPGGSSGMTTIVFVCEALFAFALCLVHCNVIQGTRLGEGKAGNDFFGLAMGFIYRGATETVRSITGGLFNPSTALGLWLSDAILNRLGDLVQGRGWLLGPLVPYVVAPLLGGLVAERAYHYQAMYLRPSAQGEQGELTA